MKNYGDGKKSGLEHTALGMITTGFKVYYIDFFKSKYSLNFF